MKILLLLPLFFLYSCSTTKKTDEVAEEATVINAVEKRELIKGGSSDYNEAGDLQTVRFDFNSAVVGKEARDLLDKNISFLKANKGIKIQLEGHTDERGSGQYNLALGEIRARRVKEYLVSMGISGKRLKVMSFGEEKPLEGAKDEEAFAKNRRVNFYILKL